MAQTEYRLVEILIRGGWVMVPLVACSLIALAVIIERLIWGPRRSNLIPEALYQETLRLIKGGQFEQATGLCRADRSPLGRLILTAIRNRRRPRSEIVEAMEVVGRQEMNLLQRRIPILGTVAAVSPLLGLLGTVLGMIKTFSVIGEGGIGNSPALAGGIAQALITTATGLAIAIPCHIFYRYFTIRARSYVGEIEQLSLNVLDELIAAPEPRGALAPSGTVG